ncbi:hypothetical protein DB32_000049 [Sandaracinus amylolyticus]|uniref:Uncharacterized protein n=1 Tax=Sandaracinus amylolyticus TaxID=927083 RepID=A0A0F6YFW2_9BACT|nr:hypothetical protein DB32_000049 [Sandaracinus amylolyticus]
MHPAISRRAARRFVRISSIGTGAHARDGPRLPAPCPRVVSSSSSRIRRSSARA